MVCLGNICRSPLAEGIMRDKISKHKQGWQVDSAGTGSWHVGSKPDSRSIAVAAKHKLDISGQNARQFTAADYEKFDIIFAMDSENFQNILKLAPDEPSKEKVHMIMNQSEPGRNQSVPDPYWDDDGFDKVFQMLDRACEAYIKGH